MTITHGRASERGHGAQAPDDDFIGRAVTNRGMNPLCTRRQGGVLLLQHARYLLKSLVAPNCRYWLANGAFARHLPGIFPLTGVGLILMRTILVCKSVDIHYRL